MSDQRPGLPRLLALSLLAAPLACSASPGASDDTGRSTGQAVTASATTLTWVGSSRTAYDTSTIPASVASDDETVVPASFVIANHDVNVLTDTYPSGAATSVTLFWANADYTATGQVAMVRTSTTDGPYADDDLFIGTLPAAALAAGQAVHYWVAAVDAGGDTLYDSQNGANYTLVPRAVSVGWAGNFGAYLADGGLSFYQVGELFNADLSTTEGCFESGEDDYAIQAVQVYAPGLTDQGYTGDLAIAAGALIDAQLWTDMRPGGWGPIPTNCRAGIGNNFVCDLPLSEFPAAVGVCLPGGNVPAGNYQYKVRFSVDGGNTWFWVGAPDGSNLDVYFNPGCPFAENDPNDCTRNPPAL